MKWPYSDLSNSSNWLSGNIFIWILRLISFKSLYYARYTILYLKIFGAHLYKKLKPKFQNISFFSFLLSDYPKRQGQKTDIVLDVKKYFEPFCYPQRNTLDSKYLQLFKKFSTKVRVLWLSCTFYCIRPCKLSNLQNSPWPKEKPDTICQICKYKILQCT